LSTIVRVSACPNSSEASVLLSWPKALAEPANGTTTSTGGRCGIMGTRPILPKKAPARMHPSAVNVPRELTRILSTLWAPGDPSWTDVSVIDRRTMSKARFVGRLVREAPRFDVTVVNGAARFHDLYQDLIGAALLARIRRPPPIVVAETAWDVGSAPLSELFGIQRFGLGGLTRLAVRALDGPHVTYCVLSEEERAMFSAAFGIPPERIACTRFGHMLWSRADGPTSDGGYLFAGGDSLRDYPTLLEAVEGIDAPVRLVTHRTFERVPANVTVGPVPYEEYVELLAGARAVAVPLRTIRRSAGLITYLNAMALGKPVIVTDSPAVREYVDDGRTGIVVPPDDPVALHDAIAWALDPATRYEAAAMGARARAEVLPPQAYWRALRDVAEQAARRRV
jgi:glycosyltransferase involved in cell wall biosynthesis